MEDKKKGRTWNQCCDLKRHLLTQRFLGLPGGCRASAVLRAERLQGCPAGRSPSGQQPLPGAQVLRFTLKTGKKFAKEAFRHKVMNASKSHENIFL